MWKVVTVDEFDQWFLGLNEAEQVSVLTVIKLLEVRGPELGRPYADTLESTKEVKNLKELRTQHQGRPYRIFFAFDPKRQAVLLCGGDKTGDKRFYKRMIPIAEGEFLKHLEKEELH
ncbi:type II toxin-antitoxin system RelE/ParE family toxin [Spartinivicinus ruber]|uniref:type II toxin-antitoxin system RelE/ParE family toxin n=1 Tax=Spartinivicinus ruber TaxID=2683272 RepID=UPI0013D39562|nr:type II toxin-antitoxin system RelE/ParE family toxin [Spartinivicinus ruber]